MTGKTVMFPFASPSSPTNHRYSGTDGYCEVTFPFDVGFLKQAIGAERSSNYSFPIASSKFWSVSITLPKKTWRMVLDKEAKLQERWKECQMSLDYHIIHEPLGEKLPRKVHRTHLMCLTILNPANRMIGVLRCSRCHKSVEFTLLKKPSVILGFSG